jgi:hypothetical protein
MAHIAFAPSPDVEPRPAAPPDYQQIQTNPREFGAGIAAGEERLGAGLTQAGQLYGEIASDDQANHVLGSIDDLTMHLRSLQGKDRMDAYPKIKAQIDQLYQQGRANLSTNDQVLSYDRQTRFLYQRSLREAGDLADEGQRQWGLATTADQEKLAINNVTRAAMAGDNDGVIHATADLANARQKRRQLYEGMNLSPDTLSQIDQSSKADATKTVVTALASSDPVRASQFLEQNKGALTGEEYLALHNHLKTNLTDQEAQQFVYGAGATPTGQNISDPRGLTPFIRQTAARYGINPDTAVRVAASEGLANPIGDQNTSFGAFQLHTAPGAMGADFQRDTGLDPSNPANEKATIDYALRRASQGGWGPFHGAARSGIGEREGIGGEGQLQAQMTEDDHAVPGLATEMDRIFASHLSPEGKVKAAELARLKYSSSWTDQTRAYEQQQRDRTQRSDNRENQIQADVFSNNPQITAQQVANDPALTPSARTRMISFINAGPEARVNPNASARVTTQILEDMRKPASDPQFVGDLGPIYDAYGQHKLTRPDFEFLQNQFTNFRGQDGQKLAEAEREFLTGMKSSITKSNPLMGNLDREGDQQFYRFQWDLHHREDDYRKAGKNPFDLMDPGKPDYFGKPETMRGYTTTLQQSSQHITDALGLQQPEVTLPSPLPVAGAAPPPAAAPQQRRPGESISDYMTRTHAPVP